VVLISLLKHTRFLNYHCFWSQHIYYITINVSLFGPKTGCWKDT